MKYVTALLEGLWGLYAWVVFLIVVLFSLLVVTVVPGLPARRWLTAAAAKTAFLLSFVPLEVNGLEALPDGHCVVVANHASYVDGPLLRAVLPSRFSFVIKGEMRDIPIVHFLLRRAGSRFVERFTAAGSARDARLIVKAAQGGQSLAFFPEGTFVEETGLGRFRPGAFVAATRGEMPVVPIAISGTRHMMPSGRWLPRPCRLRIDMLPPISLDDPTFADHRSLAAESRARILRILEEPDLLENNEH